MVKKQSTKTKEPIDKFDDNEAEDDLHFFSAEEDKEILRSMQERYSFNQMGDYINDY